MAKTKLIIEVEADDKEAIARVEALKQQLEQTAQVSGAAPGALLDKVADQAKEAKQELDKVAAAAKKAKEETQASPSSPAAKPVNPAAPTVPAVPPSPPTPPAPKPDPKSNGILDQMAEKAVNVKKGFKSMREALEGSPMAQLLSPIGAAMAVVNAAVIAGRIAWQSYLDKLREGADDAKDVRDQMVEIAAANEAKRQSDQQAMTTLISLAAVENKSNVQKSEAINIVNRLNASYQGLGLRIDEVTGKIVGLDGAQTKMLTQQRDKRVSEMKSQLKQMQIEYAESKNQMQNAGIHMNLGTDLGGLVKYGGKFQIGGEAETKEAGERQKSLTKEIIDMQRQIKEAQKEDPEKDMRLKAGANIAQAERELAIMQAKAQGNDKEAARLELVNKLYAEGVQYTANELAQREKLVAMFEEAKAQADALNEKKAKLKQEEEEIKRKAEERQKAYDDMLSQSDYEVAFAEAKLAGLDDEAARLKIINDLRSQGKYSEEQINQLMERRKALKNVENKQFVKDTTGDLDYEIAKQKAKMAGLDDEVHRLELMQQLKKENRNLDDEAIQAILAKRKELDDLVKTESLQSKANNDRPELGQMAKVGLYSFNTANDSGRDQVSLLKTISKTSNDQSKYLSEIKGVLEKQEIVTLGGT